MIPETKQEEQQREWLFHSSKVGDTLNFPSGRTGEVIKITPLYMLIEMEEGYTNLLFKDKIHFN